MWKYFFSCQFQGDSLWKDISLCRFQGDHVQESLPGQHLCAISTLGLFHRLRKSAWDPCSHRADRRCSRTWPTVWGICGWVPPQVSVHPSQSCAILQIWVAWGVRRSGSQGAATEDVRRSGACSAQREQVGARGCDKEGMRVCPFLMAAHTANFLFRCLKCSDVPPSLALSLPTHTSHFLFLYIFLMIYWWATFVVAEQ